MAQPQDGQAVRENGQAHDTKARRKSVGSKASRKSKNDTLNSAHTSSAAGPNGSEVTEETGESEDEDEDEEEDEAEEEEP